MLLNNEWVNSEIKEEIKRYIGTNEYTTTQNLWDRGKAVLGGKFIALQAYFKKQEKSQINNLTLHLKELQKEQHGNKYNKNLIIKKKTTNKAQSEQKAVIKVTAEINKIESKTQYESLMKLGWFFEKMNKIDKHLARLIKKKERGPK